MGTRSQGSAAVRPLEAAMLGHDARHPGDSQVSTTSNTEKQRSLQRATGAAAQHLLLRSCTDSFTQISITRFKGKMVVSYLADGHSNKISSEKVEVFRDGWTKLNVDASFSNERNIPSWGVGGLYLDDEEDVLLSAWGAIQHRPSAEFAEALACLK